LGLAPLIGIAGALLYRLRASDDIPFGIEAPFYGGHPLNASAAICEYGHLIYSTPLTGSGWRAIAGGWLGNRPSTCLLYRKSVADCIAYRDAGFDKSPPVTPVGFPIRAAF
jgi:hypothetical protein